MPSIELYLYCDNNMNMIFSIKKGVVIRFFKVFTGFVVSLSQGLCIFGSPGTM